MGREEEGREQKRRKREEEKEERRRNEREKKRVREGKGREGEGEKVKEQQTEKDGGKREGAVGDGTVGDGISLARCSATCPEWVGLWGGHTHLSFECPHEYSDQPVRETHHVLWIELTEGAQEVEYPSTD